MKTEATGSVSTCLMKEKIKLECIPKSSRLALARKHVKAKHFQKSWINIQHVFQSFLFIFFSFSFFRSNCKIPTSPYSQNNGSLLTNGNVEKQNQQPPAKQSMLGKLKLFGKDKTEMPKTQLSKRTSSSSGFSSARSERSDSSISLNNDSNLVSSQTSASSTKSNNNKTETTKTVTSKSSSTKAPATAKTVTKGDKKDKSQLNNNNNNQTESNGINADNQPPTKLHKIPQAKLQVSTVGRKPETTTTTKTGLSSQLQQPKTTVQSPTAVGTGIPKPMAAIKGTTKQTEDGEVRKANDDSPFDVIKLNGNEMTVQKTQLVNPIAMHNQMLNQTNNNVTSLIDNNIHTTSTTTMASNHSTNSESSVIYRPSSDTHVDIYQIQSHLNPIPNRKLENFNDSLLINGNKFNTISSKVNGMVQTSIATTIFEEDKDVSNIVPMRSLLRSGFSSCTTSPLRTNRITNGYFDDNGQGYCSDGDALRNASIRYSDIENGYLSEGANYFSMLRNNRPQLPSTIAEERWVSKKSFFIMTHLVYARMASCQEKNDSFDCLAEWKAHNYLLKNAAALTFRLLAVEICFAQREPMKTANTAEFQLASCKNRKFTIMR